MPDDKPRGYNPLRWDCDESGCFNKKCRPKIEVFADCFHGRINFGDVDGEVEIAGHFCQLEWKGEGGKIGTGQRIKFEHYTSHHGNIVFVVEGDAETMEVKRFSYFWEGVHKDWENGSLDDVKKRIRQWARMAKAGKFKVKSAA